MTRTIDPVAEKLPALLESLPKQMPIIMLNLLRFNVRADYKNESFSGSGREAYARYAAVATGKIAEVGGSVIYFGVVQTGIICPPEEIWDEILLVKYPSSDAFISMLAMTDYKDAAKHRTAALADARLIATIERDIR